jgi:hypothetical protein
VSCLRVARGVKEGLLAGHAEVDLSLIVVWVDVLAGDGRAGAEEARTLFDDRRVLQFHDGERVVGRALAPLIGMPSLADVAERTKSDLASFERVYAKGFVHGPACAFDCVFFFDEGARWGERPPEPVGWASQLDPSSWEGVDPARCFFGAALRTEIHRLAEALLARGEDEAKR